MRLSGGRCRGGAGGAAACAPRRKRKRLGWGAAGCGPDPESRDIPILYRVFLSYELILKETRARRTACARELVPRSHAPRRLAARMAGWKGESKCTFSRPCNSVCVATRCADAARCRRLACRGAARAAARRAARADCGPCVRPHLALVHLRDCGSGNREALGLGAERTAPAMRHAVHHRNRAHCGPSPHA